MADIDRNTAQSDLAFLRGLVDEDWRPGLWGFGAIYVAIGAVLNGRRSRPALEEVRA
jgi:hypothetical protein